MATQTKVDDEELQLVAEAIAKAGWLAPQFFWVGNGNEKLPAHQPSRERLRKILRALVDAKIEECVTELPVVHEAKPVEDDKEALKLLQGAINEAHLDCEVSMHHETQDVNMMGMHVGQVVTGGYATVKMTLHSYQIRQFVNYLRKC